MLTIKIRSMIAVVAALATLTGYAATATAYESVEHGTITTTITYKQLIPGNCAWVDCSLK